MKIKTQTIETGQRGFNKLVLHLLELGINIDFNSELILIKNIGDSKVNDKEFSPEGGLLKDYKYNIK